MSNKSATHFQRFEFKYPIDIRVADRIIMGVLDYMKCDKNCTEKNDYIYSVSSLYYDTFGLGSYHEKDAGIRNRKKLRLRFYNDYIGNDTKVFMEIKRKRDMVVIKDRVSMTSKEFHNLFNGGEKKSFYDKCPVDEKETLEDFMFIKAINCMEPILLISYDRRAFESLLGLDFRVTFDYNIKASLAKWLDVRPIKKITKNLVIMEIKYNNVLPSWFHDIILKYQLSRDTFSKYAMSLEACHKNFSTY